MPTRPKQRTGLWFWPLACLGFVTLTASASAEEEERGRARWSEDFVVLTYDSSMDALGPGAFESLKKAVAAWQGANPNIPRILVRRGVAAMGYEMEGANTNSVTYAKEGDPAAKGALAVTVVTFGGKPKRIVDADIVINGEHRFTTAAPTEVEAYDLQNVLAHEIGHLLGLGEDPHNELATMYPYSSPRETLKHDLDETDREALALHYPPKGHGVTAAIRERLARAVKPR